MSSIVRPSPAQITRRLIVLACAVFAVVVAQAQLLMGWGQTPSEFLDESAGVQPAREDTQRTPPAGGR